MVNIITPSFFYYIIILTGSTNVITRHCKLFTLGSGYSLLGYFFTSFLIYYWGDILQGITLVFSGYFFSDIDFSFFPNFFHIHVLDSGSIKMT